MLAEQQIAKVGRIAFREEGDNWNAYYAMTGTLEGALFLGSIRRAAVENPARKQAFISLMRELVTDAVEASTGIRPIWGDPETGPENERTRNA